ncbi:MAG: hypothetical protein ACI9K5_004172, partial [Gammaproteobacteria bacterium]
MPIRPEPHALPTIDMHPKETKSASTNRTVSTYRAAGRQKDVQGGSLGHLMALPLVLMATGLGFWGWFQREQVTELEGRILLLETSSQTTSAHQNGVRSGLNIMGSEIATLTERIGEAALEARSAREVAGRLEQAEERLGAISQAVEATSSNLNTLEGQVGPIALEAVLTEREGRLQETWDTLKSSISEEVSVSRARLNDVEERLDQSRDLETMWDELMGPVVQLAGETSVGSGVLLQSEERAAGGFRTYVLTAWHVVRDIQGSPSSRDMPVPVTIYSVDGSLRHEEAMLLVYKADLDAALLEILTPEALPRGATLASPEHLEQVRIFDPIYAVGCPLGNDPIPTYGE